MALFDKVLDWFIDLSKTKKIFFITGIIVIVNVIVAVIVRNVYVPLNEPETNVLLNILKNIGLHILCLILCLIALFLFLEMILFILFNAINILYNIFYPVIKLFKNIYHKIVYRKSSLKNYLKTINVCKVQENGNVYSLNRILTKIKNEYRRFKIKYTRNEQFTEYFTTLEYKISSDNNYVIIEMYQSKKPRKLEVKGQQVYFHKSSEFPGGASFPVYCFNESFYCVKTITGYSMVEDLQKFKEINAKALLPKFIKHISNMAAGVSSVSFSKGSKYFAAGAKKDEYNTYFPAVDIYDSQTGILVKTFKLIPQKGVVLCKCDNNNDFVLGSYGNCLKIWNLISGEEIFNYKFEYIQDLAISSIAFDYNKSIVAYGTYSTYDGKGYIRLLDIKTGNILNEITNEDNSGIRAIDISNDSNKIIYSSANGYINIYDIKNDKIVFKIDKVVNNDCNLKYSHDNNFFIISNTLYDANTYNELFAFETTGDISSTAFSYDNKYVAICDSKTIKVFDIGTKKLLLECLNEIVNYDKIELSPNNKYLVSGSDRGDVALFDLKDLLK